MLHRLSRPARWMLGFMLLGLGLLAAGGGVWRLSTSAIPSKVAISSPYPVVIVTVATATPSLLPPPATPTPTSERRWQVTTTPATFVSPETGTPAPVLTLAYLSNRSMGVGHLVEVGGLLPPGLLQMNMWLARTADRSLRIIAGGYQENRDLIGSPRHGVVIVEVSTLAEERLPDETGYFELPGTHGLLRIVDAIGATLSLLADDGTVATFDATTRSLAIAANQAPPQRASGQGTIVESGLSPYPLADYVFTNQWYQEVDGQRLTLFAGADRATQQESIVVIVTASAAQPDVGLSTEVYQLSFPVSQLLIMDVVDNEVRLSSIGGTAVVFDLLQRKFTGLPY